MRFVFIAAAVVAAILGAAVPAHADTHSYLRCIHSDAQIPPGTDARNWLPSVAVIESDISSGKSGAQIADELAVMGVKPDDAALQVRCVMENWPVGSS